MDWDERLEASHRAESLSWSRKFNEARKIAIVAWVSTFRDNQKPEVISDTCESFNWGCKVRFQDGVQWILRPAVPGRVMKGDQKIRHEVAVMQFLKNNTKIPVPSLVAWGCADKNPLGIGPFILMKFVEGQPSDEILVDKSRESEGVRILRPDVTNHDLEVIYRQIANILLELSTLGFQRIGSLSSETAAIDEIEYRPLTLKLNEIESHGGISVGEHHPQSFRSVSEYFSYVIEQDIEHLHKQPNSIDAAEDAREKYRQYHAAKALVPNFVEQRYNKRPFKLICDDFRLGNILVDNAQDLKIVAALDWDWSYAAPFQMLYSPPRWLLIKKPLDWDDQDVDRYNGLLKLFAKVLEEEQDKYSASESTANMASCMRDSMDDGKFWFHELIYSCFEGPDNRAWKAVRKYLPCANESTAIAEHDVESFVKEKLGQLTQYNEEWAIMERELERKEDEFEALRQKIEEEDRQMRTA